ncbi:MAG: HlyD family efflux transporter periplasmic adaptor subunit [Pseudomonadota bacterium]
MKIIREKPCQRRHHRVTAPLKVTLYEGRSYMATDWSLGGLRIDNIEGELPEVESPLDLELELPFQGFDISFSVKSKVVRRDRDRGMIAVEFTELSERGRDLLSHFIEDLIRGKMGSVEDAICRIDIPVTPISTKPDVNPSADVPTRRWPIKTIVMTGFYITFGLAVFGYAALLTYSTVMRLEVKSAVLSAPLTTLKMPVDGFLVPVSLEEGQTVRKGDLIARIENPALNQRIEETRLRVARARDSLFHKEQKVRIEKERMKLYRLVSDTNHEIAAAKLDAHRAEMKAADGHYLRISKLAKEGFATTAMISEARKRQEEAEAKVREAELILERTTAMKRVSGRRHYNHKVFVSDLDMMQVELSEARAHLETEETRLAHLMRVRTAQIIRSPANGQIVSIFQSPDAAVSRHDPLMTIEISDQLSVTAFLDQEEVLQVGLSDEASIYIPGLNEHLTAKVTAIDRNAAFLDPQANHYTWRAEDARTAAVSLKFTATPQQIEDMRAGLPAVVIFSKRTTNDIYGRLSRLFSRGEEIRDGTDI